MSILKSRRVNLKLKFKKNNRKGLINYGAKLIKFQMNLTLYKTLFTH